MTRKGAGKGQWFLGQCQAQAPRPDLAGVPSDPTILDIEMTFPSKERAALCSVSFEAIDHLLRISDWFYVVRT